MSSSSESSQDLFVTALDISNPQNDEDNFCALLKRLKSDDFNAKEVISSTPQDETKEIMAPPITKAPRKIEQNDVATSPIEPQRNSEDICDVDHLTSIMFNINEMISSTPRQQDIISAAPKKKKLDAVIPILRREKTFCGTPLSRDKSSKPVFVEEFHSSPSRLSRKLPARKDSFKRKAVEDSGKDEVPVKKETKTVSEASINMNQFQLYGLDRKKAEFVRELLKNKKPIVTSGRLTRAKTNFRI